MADVQISFATLNLMAASTKQVAVQLDDSDDSVDELLILVDEPFPGRSELANALEGAAASWSFLRSRLVDRTTQAAQRMDAVGAAWEHWDAGAGVAQESALPPLPGSD